jgi:hypothetical protein
MLNYKPLIPFNIGIGSISYKHFPLKMNAQHNLLTISKEGFSIPEAIRYAPWFY